MVVNLNMHGTEQGGIADWLSDTIAGVFPEVMTVDVPGNTNRELFAGGAGMKEKLAKHTQDAENEQLRGLLTQISDQVSVYRSGGRTLTDDKAPVELLGMKELDGLIRQEAEPYKKIYREEGLQGLLGSF